MSLHTDGRATPRRASRSLRGQLATCLVLLLPACSGAERDVQSLILITVDTLRADHLGAYGGTVPTPALDALAAESVLLTDMCTPTPSTGPAHASLFTGLYPWNHGVLGNAAPFPDESIPRLAEYAGEAGLATAAFVSSYVLHARWGFDRGFDEFHFEPTEEGVWKRESVGFFADGSTTLEAALAFINDHRSQRFFVWLHLFDPHFPYSPPPDYRRPSDEAVDLRGKAIPPELNSPEQLAQAIRGYRGEVSYVDALMGRLLAGLRRAGVDEETAVVFTSDHGEGLGDHQLLEHGRNLFDELVRVPLLVRAPGLPPGRRLSGPAQLEDLMPTILALLGIATPERSDGLDLLPWLRGEAPHSPRESVLGQRAPFPGKPVLFFERRPAEKWIGPLQGAAGRLYRLDDDPKEERPQPIAEVPERLLRSTGGRARPAPSQRLDPEARRALEALGYLESGRR
jgi:choline-sulfatase